MRQNSILVADDHKLFAEAIAAKLSHIFQQVEIVLSLAELRTRLMSKHFDLVTLDLNFHDISSLTVLPSLAKEYPRTRFLVVTACAQRALVDASRRAGAAGFVVKESSTGELLRGIDLALSGREFISPQLLRGAHRPVGMRASPGIAEQGSPVTPKELAVIALIHAGATQKEAARQLGVQLSTVEYHLSEARIRLGVNNTAVLVRWYEEYLAERDAPSMSL